MNIQHCTSKLEVESFIMQRSPVIQLLFSLLAEKTIRKIMDMKLDIEGESFDMFYVI